MRSFASLVTAAAFVIAAWWTARWLVPVEVDAGAIERLTPETAELVAARTALRRLADPSQVAAMLAQADAHLAWLARSHDREARGLIEPERAAVGEALHAPPARRARSLPAALERLDGALAQVIGARLASTRELARQIGDARRGAERDTLRWHGGALAVAVALALFARRRLD